MTCSRCRGLMVVDHFIDMQDDAGKLWLRAWRCVMCGEVVDPLIQRHRIIQTNSRRPIPVAVPKARRQLRQGVA